MTVPYPDLPYKPQQSRGLDLSLRISTVKGWLELSMWPYEPHAESFASTTRTQRRLTATNPYIPGQFTVNAIPDNVTEQVMVWVGGDSHYELEAATDALIAAFEQTRFLLERRFEDSLVLWQCFAADVSITTNLEHRHARMSLVNAQVPRLPRAQRSLA